MQPLDEAIRQFQSTLDVHPEDVLTHVALMRAYFQTGRQQEALDIYQKSLVLRGAGPEVSAAAGEASQERIRRPANASENRVFIASSFGSEKPTAVTPCGPP